MILLSVSLYMLCTKQLFVHFHLDKKAAKWIKYFRKLIHHKISVILQRRIKCLELGDQEGGTRKIFKKKNKEKTIQTDQEKNKYKRGKREANQRKLVFCDI